MALGCGLILNGICRGRRGRPECRLTANVNLKSFSTLQIALGVSVVVHAAVLTARPGTAQPGTSAWEQVQTR